MNSTQNRKIAQVKNTTLVIGIDVGSEFHYARAFDNRGYEFSSKPFKFSNTEHGFLELVTWMQEIKEKQGMEDILAGMEPTGHYWFCLGTFLKDNGIRPVLVNPHHVKKSKELDDNSQSKNDRKDPKVIAGLVKDGRYSHPYIPEGVYAELRTASNLRFRIESELTSVKNRLARWISIYFPELPEGVWKAGRQRWNDDPEGGTTAGGYHQSWLEGNQSDLERCKVERQQWNEESQEPA